MVIALGGKTKDVGPTMLQDGTAAIVRQMEARGVRRIAVVTSIGAGDSEGQAPFVFVRAFVLFLRFSFFDCARLACARSE